MKKIWQLIKRHLSTVVRVGCFLGCLIILVPLIIGTVFFDTQHSINTTKYVLLGILAFLFLVIGIIVPYTRKVMHFLGIPDRANILDGLTTIGLIPIWIIFLIPLTLITLVLLRIESLRKYQYWIFYHSALIALFLLGVRVRLHGKMDLEALLKIGNHTSPIDYLLSIFFALLNPWNIIAGINLRRNKKSLEDKIVRWTIGKIVEEHSISVDRNDWSSKTGAARKIMSAIRNGLYVANFAEDGRTPKEMILNEGVILRDFKDGMFRIAFDEGILIQPVVFDWPVTWRGKGDEWWGIHVGFIDIYYLPSIDPKNFSCFEELKKACWDAMHEQLINSKNVQRFLSKND